jgi:hypothetical protein
MQYTVLPNVALWNADFQWMRTVLIEQNLTQPPIPMKKNTRALIKRWLTPYHNSYFLNFGLSTFQLVADQNTELAILSQYWLTYSWSKYFEKEVISDLQIWPCYATSKAGMYCDNRTLHCYERARFATPGVFRCANAWIQHQAQKAGGCMECPAPTRIELKKTYPMRF